MEELGEFYPVRLASSLGAHLGYIRVCFVVPQNKASRIFSYYPSFPAPQNMIK
jgi:hypothetical protein